MKTESKIRIFGLTMFAASSLYFAAYVKANDFPDKNNQAFYNGEILIPDYVHSDTLVVINANLLNDEISNCSCSDGSYYDLLGEGCVNIADYEDYIKVVASK